MTADQYHKAVTTFEQDRLEAMINRIPQNINRAGKHYRKLVKQIKLDYGGRQNLR